MRAISLKPNEFSLKRDALGSSAEGTVYGLYIHKYLAVHIPPFGDLGTEDALEKFLEENPISTPASTLPCNMSRRVTSSDTSMIALEHFLVLYCF